MILREAPLTTCKTIAYVQKFWVLADFLQLAGEAFMVDQSHQCVYVAQRTVLSFHSIAAFPACSALQNALCPEIHTNEASLSGFNLSRILTTRREPERRVTLQ
jgi:hypothetical protein